MTEKQLKQLVDDRFKNIERLEGWTDRQFKTMQEELLKLVEKYMRGFDREAGIIVRNVENISKVNKIDAVIFPEFEKEFLKPFLQELGERMLKMQQFNEKYFAALGFKASGIDKIQKRLDWISEMVGIKGNSIIKGSFLDTLSDIPSVKGDIKLFAMQQIGNPASTAKNIREGLTQIVTGSKEVGGTIERGIRKYTHDTLFKLDAAIDETYAQGFGLEYFVYQGTEIDTSRQFCIDRMGKVFSIKDTESWYDDDNLPKQKGEERTAYNPLIDRGRWNCRHYIRWITKERAAALGYPVKV